MVKVHILKVSASSEFLSSKEICHGIERPSRVIMAKNIAESVTIIQIFQY